MKIVYRYTQEFLQQARAIHLATWGPRFVALLVDFLLISLPFNFLGNLIWISKAINQTDTDVVYRLGIPLELHNVLWIVAFGAYGFFMNKRRGATLGEGLMNLKVVGENYGKLAPLMLFGRYVLIAYALVGTQFFLAGWSGFGSFFSVGIVLVPAVVLLTGFLLYFFDDRKQTAHDKAVKSLMTIADPTRI